MRFTTYLLTAVVLGGCAAAPTPTPSADEGRNLIVVWMNGNGDGEFYWDGWKATPADLPRLIEQYHPKRIVVSTMKGYIIDYDAAIKLRTAIQAAGASDVRIGSGGMVAN